ncbi:MAG: DMT family transporter [Alphaproteobacteria bacterium]|nr:DMT family transporter [Alphaproteobacteria bacterium]
MKSDTAKGYLNGIAAAIGYGTNPLFALPLYANGLGVNSVLFYRYLSATIIYGLWLKLFKQISFKITFKEFLGLFLFAVIFAYSDIFIFEAFKYMDSGLACTILFVYPLIVALISKIIYKENVSRVIWLALVLVISGICLLYNSQEGLSISLKGLIYVLLGALSYAIYMVGIKHSKILKQTDNDKLVFYVMLFGLSVYVCNLRFLAELQPLNNWFCFLCILGLAILPTIISLETITRAIRYIGATRTAILGALEPITALFFGVLLFNETISLKILAGIILVLSGVIFVIHNSDI